MMQCFLLHFPPIFPLQGLQWDFVAVVIFLLLSFGSEDGSLESPGFDHDQGNLWSLSRYRPHVEEGGTFRVPLAYGKFTKLGVGLSIMTHQGPTHPSIPLGTLTLCTKVPLKGSPILRSLNSQASWKDSSHNPGARRCPRTLLPTSQGGWLPKQGSSLWPDSG